MGEYLTPKGASWDPAPEMRRLKDRSISKGSSKRVGAGACYSMRKGSPPIVLLGIGLEDSKKREGGRND